jgi:hypothetical protein
MGPGLYEVCRSSTREPIAFGCTRNVAESLCDILKPRGLRRWLSFRRGRSSYDTGELEYRTWATATLGDAKNAVGVIRERHEAVMRRYTAAART